MRDIDHFGAALLGAAIRTVFPRALYRGYAVDGRGFCATFSDDHPFQANFLILLREAMVDLCAQPAQVMEMEGKNAIELLAHHGQPADQSLRGLVFVAQLGPFFEVCKRFPKACEAFSLLSFSRQGDTVTVHGKAFETKQEKQRFDKLYRNFSSHRDIAKRLELYEEEIWHSRGLLLRQALLDLRKRFLKERGFALIEAPDPLAYSSAHQMEAVSCSGREFCFGPRALERASQLMREWVDLFGWESRWSLARISHQDGRKDERGVLSDFPRFCGKFRLGQKGRADVEVRDFLGCYQKVATIEPIEKGSCFSLWSDLDQWIALLLEKDQGSLPLWLVPEQVRLLSEESVAITEVTKIFSAANIRYTVDCQKLPVKEKIHRALRVNVPYVMVFGKREERKSRMTIRALSSRKSETIFLDQLHRFLVERIV